METHFTLILAYKLFSVGLSLNWRFIAKKKRKQKSKTKKNKPKTKNKKRKKKQQHENQKINSLHCKNKTMKYNKPKILMNIIMCSYDTLKRWTTL